MGTVSDKEIRITVTLLPIEAYTGPGTPIHGMEGKPGDFRPQTIRMCIDLPSNFPECKVSSAIENINTGDE
jgi:hypothetical protein